MKVLVTGGAGYIGTELIYALAERNDISEVIIYDNLARKNYNLFIGQQKLPANKVRFIQGDLLDSRKLRKSLQGVEVVYHLAAKVTKPYSDHNPHLLEQVNHWGTAELVYAIEESDVSKLIYTSSSAVYGALSHTDNEPVSYQTPPLPSTYYGTSKLRGEEHVERIRSKIPAYILRVANVYGYSKSMRFDARINRFMWEAACGLKITVNGAGEQIRPYIHINDVTRVLSGLLTNDLARDSYDLVTRNLSIHQIVDGVSQVFPETEFIYINQHIEPWELSLKPDRRLEGLLPYPEQDFNQEIEEFKRQFSFIPESPIVC